MFKKKIELENRGLKPPLPTPMCIGLCKKVRVSCFPASNSFYVSIIVVLVLYKVKCFCTGTASVLV